MRKFVLLAAVAVCALAFNPLTAQFKDSFDDGNFTQNPAWQGSTADWQVNTALQLQSNNTVASSTYYLSTANTLATQAQWEFYVNLAFNTSSANYVDVYLTASLADLTNTAVTGYFVRIGNTDDEISLYRKDAGTAISKLIDGVNGITNTSNNVLKIKVIRASDNSFTLFRDATGTGNNYVSEGTIADATYTTSSYFGLLVKQSTASFFQKHYFDDFEIKAYTPDVTPPAIQSLNATSNKVVEVLFNEPVDAASAQTVSNYTVNNGLGSPEAAVIDGSNPALVRLTFNGTFANGVTNTLAVAGVKDIAGNAITTASGTFSFFVPQPFNVVIDEIMADPDPVVSLPNAEYIELRNTTTQNINLQGWRLKSTSSTSGLMPSFILQPDSTVIITGTSSAPLFASYGKVIALTSFPSLDNNGTVLSLVSKENLTIHAVEYSIDWYQNAVKRNGGWSLEMVDTKNPCSGSENWKASTDASGGTPGRKNSVDGSNKDTKAPAIVRAAGTSTTSVLVTFSEPLDSTKMAIPGNYSISDGINAPISASPVAPLFKQVVLQLANPITAGKVYTLTVNNVADCAGNVIQAVKTVRVGLAAACDSGDVIVNEILFDPTPAAVDYVEIYNRSQKIIDLKDLYLTNRSSTTNALGTLRQLATDAALMFPGDFYVISESDAIVKQNYVAKNPDQFINLSTMPSYPDDKGFVVVMNSLGKIVDEVDYSVKWHYRLLDNEEGISLERIDYTKPSQDPSNWFSAASTVGYGTPSYQNSQFRADLQAQGEITITPKTFSPDNDGTDDFTTINYQMTELGYVANITIFDASGRPVKLLAKNATLALKGNFRWDGLDDKMNKLPVGSYVIFTEVFNLNGKKKSFKNVVVLARRF